MQIMISRGAGGLREAKHLYHARILIPTTAPGGHQFGDKRRVVDMQFIRRDAHDMTVFGVHVANAEDVLATAEVVMVKLKPEGHRCEARTGKFSKRVQGKAVGVEEYDIEDPRRSDARQGPGDEKIKGRHGVSQLATARPKSTKFAVLAWTSGTGNRNEMETG